MILEAPPDLGGGVGVGAGVPTSKLAGVVGLGGTTDGEDVGVGGTGVEGGMLGTVGGTPEGDDGGKG